MTCAQQTHTSILNTNAKTWLRHRVMQNKGKTRMYMFDGHTHIPSSWWRIMATMITMIYFSFHNFGIGIKTLIAKRTSSSLGRASSLYHRRLLGRTLAQSILPSSSCYRIRGNRMKHTISIHIKIRDSWQFKTHTHTLKISTRLSAQSTRLRADHLGSTRLINHLSSPHAI